MQYIPIAQFDISKLESQLKNTILPRNFLLLDELKNSKDYTYVNYGLQDDNINLTTWAATIITNSGNIIPATLICDENYPNSRPTITFTPPLNQTITASIATIPWTPTTHIGDYLMEIRKKIPL